MVNGLGFKSLAVDGGATALVHWSVSFVLEYFLHDYLLATILVFLVLVFCSFALVSFVQKYQLVKPISSINRACLRPKQCAIRTLFSQH